LTAARAPFASAAELVAVPEFLLRVAARSLHFHGAQFVA